MVATLILAVAGVAASEAADVEDEGNVAAALVG